MQEKSKFLKRHLKMLVNYPCSLREVGNSCKSHLLKNLSAIPRILNLDKGVIDTEETVSLLNTILMLFYTFFPISTNLHVNFPIVER